MATPTGAAAPTATPTPSEPVGTPEVVVSCVFFDGVVARVESDEYVQIQNLGSADQAMAGWSLIDLDDGGPTFVFPAVTLSPGQSVRVYTNEIHPGSGGFSFGHGSAIWNNSTPDLAGLRDAAGNIVSTATYPPGC